MTDIDIDAIRRQVPFIWAHWSAIQDTAQPGLVTDRLICTQQSADDVPTVLRWVDALTREVERLRTEREHMELNPTGTAEWLKNRVNELTAALAAARAHDPMPGFPCGNPACPCAGQPAPDQKAAHQQ